MQIRNFTAGMPAGMTGRIRGLVLRSQKILKRAGRHALFLQPRGVWSGSGVPDQNGKDVIFAL